jgi:hypothetical protein
VLFFWTAVAPPTRKVLRALFEWAEGPLRSHDPTRATTGDLLGASTHGAVDARRNVALIADRSSVWRGAQPPIGSVVHSYGQADRTGREHTLPGAGDAAR